MATIFTSTLANQLKETLQSVVHDSNTASLDMGKWMSVGTMDDNYVDDVEYAGPALAAVKGQGDQSLLASALEGVLTRYTAFTFAIRLNISQEALEDGKYNRVISYSKQLVKSLLDTAEVDSTNILNRATNVLFPGGDGLPLASAAHTLPHGGTFSNLGATAAPSHASLAAVVSQMRKLPGHNGVTQGYKGKCVVCPTEQWADWERLLKSTLDPQPDSFDTNPGSSRGINVMKTLGLDIVPLKFWTATALDWGVVTDAPDGFKFLWRKRPSSTTSVDHDHGTMTYGARARWARGWSNPRAIIYSPGV